MKSQTRLVPFKDGNNVMYKKLSQLEDALNVIKTNILEAKYISIKEKGLTRMITASDIIMIKSDSNYSKIYLNNGIEILTSKTLKHWSSILEGNTFLRVHASYLINRNHIVEIKNNKRNILMNNNLNATISRQPDRKNLLKEINLNQFKHTTMKYLVITFLILISKFVYSQSVGIGTVTPDSKLNIAGGTEASLSNGTGYFLIGLKENQNLVFDNNELQSRNNGVGDDLYLNPHGGNVAIGTTNANVKLKIDGGTDASLSGGGYVQIGPTNGLNIIMDDNEIMARDNADPSVLIFQNDGGKTLMGGDVEVDGVVSGAFKFQAYSITIPVQPDNEYTISIGNKSYILINNEDPPFSFPGTATHIYFSDGEAPGQFLTLSLNLGSEPIYLNDDNSPASTNYDLDSQMTLNEGGTLTFIWNGSTWLLLSKSLN